MSDWRTDDFPWADESDSWFRRSYIGDDDSALQFENVEREKRIACFYDSDGEKEEIDLSDLSSEDDEANQKSAPCAYPRIRFKRTKNGYLYTIIAR